jgi:DedD protein
VVLVALAVIFVPSLLREQQPEPVDTRTQIPERPAIEPLTFEVPQQPDNIEPAPAPETMFVPDDPGQPVLDDLESAERPDGAEALEQADTVSQAEPAKQPEAREPPAEAGVQAWVVQVASFSNLETANKLRDRLQEQGYKAYVRSVNIGSSTVSRVYIGPKLDRAEAESIKSEVDKSLRVDALVLKFQP